MTTVTIWLPSARSSSIPVTVTVCATFQFAAVNVRLALSMTASPGSLDHMSTITSAVGTTLSATVNSVSSPSSLMGSGETWMMRRTESSSMFVRVMFCGVMAA